MDKEKERVYKRNWARKHPETLQRYYRQNRSAIIRKVVAYRANRLATDSLFRLIKNCRNRVLLSLKPGNMKQDRTWALIGCTPIQLKAWLERHFLPGMSWSNRHLWHIDHKKPLAKFDLSRESEQRMTFHYTNLQPLWAADNLRKGAR